MYAKLVIHRPRN